MSGPHDLGGDHGYGPVVIEDNEPTFHEPWERVAVALSFATKAQFAVVDEIRHARERMHPVDYLSSSYYEKWVTSLETLLVEKGVLTAEELHRRRNEIANGSAPSVSHDKPELVERILSLARNGGSAHRDVDRAPRFEVGDEVVTINDHPVGHTRLPQYARGRRGVVEIVQDAFVLPDAITAGQGERPEHVYTIRFEAAELWGRSAEPRCVVYLDLWSSYLRPAAEQRRTP